ncbi:hypothetical protein M422DRAFT_77445, partial [Sphaerobolus stellatus SS14]
SNYPPGFRPTATEREATKRQFIEQKSNLDAVNAQIVSLSGVLRKLEQRRDELQTSLAHGTDLLSPIRKLPTEILQRIFIFCMP